MKIINVPGYNLIRRLLLLTVMTVNLLPLAGVSWPSEMNTGVARLIGKGLSPSSEYLTRSLSMELLEQVSQCREHVFLPEEREAFKLKFRKEALSNFQKELDKLLVRRDQMFFDQARESDQRVKLDEDIRILRQKQADLRNDAVLLSPPETLPLLPAEKNLQGELLDPPAGSMEFYKSENLDLLVWGTLEEVESLLFFSVEIYSFLEGKTVFQYHEAALPEAAGGFIANIRPLLRECLLGRPWADLKVALEGDILGEISLDGIPGGVSRLEASCLIPGEHKIEVRAEGYLPWTGTVVLTAGEERKLDVVLDSLPKKRIPIRSYPPGADIFIDAQWLGATPLIIDVPGKLTRILLRKEGYPEYTYFINPRKPVLGDIILGDEKFLKDNYMELQRNQFYRSLGTFFLSIPVSILMYSAYSGLGQAFNQEYSTYGDTAEAERLYSLGNFSYYGYLGALAFNGVCFVNLILDAVSYVRSAGLDFKE